MGEKLRLYVWLCGVNLCISAFTFGGGYVVVPMIRKFFVEQKKIFQEQELMEMAALAQSSPGAIAVNLSALAGKRAAGSVGAVLSSICAVLPSIVILGLISKWYEAFSANLYIAAALKGMQACAAALIVSVVLDLYQMIQKEKSVFLSLLVPGAFGANFFLGMNVAIILAVSCIISMLVLFKEKRKKEEERRL